MSARSRRIWRRLGGVCAVAASLLAGATAWAGWLQATGNVHEVVPQVLYRSAQLGGDQLAAQIAAHGIRSVLNLRGAKPGTPWYEAEMRASDAAGVTHADFALSAGRMITADETEALAALMRDLPKPILVHCKQGADRTGFASALYLWQLDGQPEEEAEAQLSFRYGHVSIPYLSAAWPMDQSWEALEARVAAQGDAAPMTLALN